MKGLGKLYTRHILASFTILLLAACGGGGGGGGNTATPTTPTPPPAPSPPSSAASAELDPTSVKTLRFTWQDVGDATHYQLLENPDGSSGFTQVGGDIAQGVGVINHVVPLYARLNAQYILQSCNTAGCIDSSAISVTKSLTPAIGYVKASNTEADDEFGRAISLSADGSTLAVGAAMEDSSASGIDGDQNDNSAERSGAVYVFSRVGGDWSQQAYLKASNSEDADQFGIRVNLSATGNTLAVGASGEDSDATGIDGNQSDNSAEDAGAVYVFSRSGDAWSQQAYVKASNTGVNDRFGSAMSLSADGNTLAVAASLEDSSASGIDGNQANNSTSTSGAVYVFSRSGDAWSQQAYVKASNTGVSDRFGFAVGLSADGNTLAVGAHFEDSNASGIDGNQSDNSAGASGAVYVFSRSGDNWSQQAYVKASNTDASDEFGSAVSLSADGNTLAVGSQGESSNASGIDGDQSDNSAGNSGAVYVFSRSGDDWLQQAYIKASNTDFDDRFGIKVGVSADGNRLLVSAERESSSATGIGGSEGDNSLIVAGAVYVFGLDGGAWFQLAYVKAGNTESDDEFGRGISLSADGGTVAIGAHGEDSNAGGIDGDQDDNSAQNSGAVYLY